MVHESRATEKAAELAPRWHTALLVGLMLAVAISGTLLQQYATPPATALTQHAADTRILGQYAPILCVNWGLLLYVSRLFRSRNALPDLLGRRWHSLARASCDLGLALAVCALIQLLEALFSTPVGAGRNAAILALLPRTEAERLSWVLVALSVGFCEEVVYRGYLRTQLAAFTGSAGVGIVSQAALFGIAHADQGLRALLRIACYGLIFGLLAQFRRSLLPGIVAHVAIDLASGMWR